MNKTQSYCGIVLVEVVSAGEVNNEIVNVFFVEDSTTHSLTIEPSISRIQNVFMTSW